MAKIKVADIELSDKQMTARELFNLVLKILKSKAIKQYLLIPQASRQPIPDYT